MALYSLFEKQDGKWVRISSMALSLASARQHFQSALLAYALGGSKERSLRRV